MNNYSLDNLTVLIVESHSQLRRIIRDILQTLGIERIHEATNEVEAFEIFKEESEEPIDLILTDWSPLADGIALLNRVRDMEVSDNPYVPVVIISANTELRQIFHARDRGMTEFLAKPITATLIYSRICSVIDRVRPFIRSSGFFGPDRRRRRLGPQRGHERREHTNMNGNERRLATLPYVGPDRRYSAPEVRHDDRVAIAV